MENFKIISHGENLLFGRKEILAETESNSVPKKSDVEKFFSEKFSSPVENVAVKKIAGKFGTKVFQIGVFIYDSKDNKDHVEIKTKSKAAPAA